MKLIEKQRAGSKVRKKYDTPATPCDRLLACAKVGEETKIQLRATRRGLDPMDLAADIEARLGRIFTIVERIEEDRLDEMGACVVILISMVIDDFDFMGAGLRLPSLRTVSRSRV